MGNVSKSMESLDSYPYGVIWIKRQENMLGGCPDFVVLIWKSSPRVFCSLPPPRCSNPNWTKPWQQGLSPEQDLGLGPSGAAPSSLTAATATGHSNSTLCNGTTPTSIYSFYLTHFFLHYRDCLGHDMTLVTVPELNKKTRHSPAVKASQLPSFSQKLLCFIFTRFNTLFDSVFNCGWSLIAQYLPPACPPGFGNSLLVHIRSVLWTGHLKPHFFLAWIPRSE